LKTYTYDGLNRLKEFDYGDSTTTVLESFSYDVFGNIASRDRTNSQGSQNLIFESTENRLLKIGGANIGWVRGNLVSMPALGTNHEKTFWYSGENRMMESTDDPVGFATRMRYAYDASGERVARWWMNGSDLEARFYVRDEGGRVLSEWLYKPDSFDVYRDHIFGASGQIAQVQYSDTTDLSYIAADHLGSTRVVFTENTFEEMDYYPFGEFLFGEILDPATDLLFTGHERDSGDISSELDYMHARYYSPTLARFVSVDPVSGSIGSSQSWNRYSYVENNPVGFIDPNGALLIRAIARYSRRTAEWQIKYRVKFEKQAAAKDIPAMPFGPLRLVNTIAGATKPFEEQSGEVLATGNPFSKRDTGSFDFWNFEIALETEFQSLATSVHDAGLLGDDYLAKQLDFLRQAVENVLAGNAFQDLPEETRKKILETYDPAILTRQALTARMATMEGWKRRDLFGHMKRGWVDVEQSWSDLE